jgi:mRNA-degrading endonuclease RelE of RelBE toxin-antitoxin system
LNPSYRAGAISLKKKLRLKSNNLWRARRETIRIAALIRVEVFVMGMA